MKRRSLGVLLAVSALAACGSNGALTGPTTALSPEVATAVVNALQDEYHAEQTYLRVMADFGTILPFSNVIYAEQRHSDALAAVLARRALPIPSSLWNQGNVPTFTSIPQACAGAAEAEVANIALYDELLRLDLPNDVRNVFTNNRAASQTKHLPAFLNCR